MSHLQILSSKNFLELSFISALGTKTNDSAWVEVLRVFGEWNFVQKGASQEMNGQKKESKKGLLWPKSFLRSFLKYFIIQFN